MTATDVEERAILDQRIGGVTAIPSTWYIGLSKETPNDDGTNFVEPIGGSYARVAKTNNTTNFPAASTTSGVTRKTNGTKVTWPNPTADWGTVTHYGFFDSATGGTPRYVLKIRGELQIRSGNTPVEFDIGQMVITAD